MDARTVIRRLLASVLVLMTACSTTWHALDTAQLRAHAYDHATLLVVTEDHAFELADSRVIDGTPHGTAVASWALTPGVSSEPRNGDSIDTLVGEHGWRDTNLGRPRFATSSWPALTLDLAHVQHAGLVNRAMGTPAKAIVGGVAVVAAAIVGWFLLVAFGDALGSLDAPR